ncbi:MAG: DUF1501 domain-containing protein [Planctomycetaceae bacterium]
MLRVLGSPKRLCDGLTRRDLLHVGGTAFGGLGLSQLLQSGASAARASTADSFGRAKQCIVLFLYGSPSQLETFDMKPGAPAEVRGTMRPIASSLPGLDVCEHLPHLAKVMDRTTVIRSVTHPYPIHGVAYAMTGIPIIDVAMELNPRDVGHHPYFGSCVEFLERPHRSHTAGAAQNIALPFPFSSKRSDQPFRAGPYASYLGAAYDPLWTEFVGDGTRSCVKARPGFRWEGQEPYLGCTGDSHFRLAAVEGGSGMVLDRLNRRRSLADQFGDARRDLDRSLAGSSLTQFEDLAYRLLAAPEVGRALDVRQEPDSVRDLYGMTLFGQSCLAARRLIECGTRLVSVFWDEFGLAGDAWDTHYEHFPRMVDQLLPGLDQSLYGLLTDLEQRGLLDDTLVVLVSEHGRTPSIQNIPGGGRDHWSRAYSVLMAGGGVQRGNVIGATDEIAGDVVDRPISPKSILATMYHLLGIDPHTQLFDRSGRGLPLVPDTAEVITEVLA